MTPLHRFAHLRPAGSTPPPVVAVAVAWGERTRSFAWQPPAPSLLEGAATIVGVGRPHRC
eukprot:366442-Chlamydomonas_euryale.AAC.5